MKTYMEYLQNLPTSMQFILLLITVLGSTGFISGMVAVWKLYAKADTDKELIDAKTKQEKEITELKMRLEPLELERLRAQNEGKQNEAMNTNMKNLIDVIAAQNDRWQTVVDKKSERQLEAEKMQHEDRKLFAEAMRENTSAIRNLTEMIEIQSEHYQVFKESVDGMKSKLDTTLQTVEGLARDNRTDLTTALGISVTSRTENENTLRTIKDTIHGVVKEITGVIEKNNQTQSKTLLSIKTQLQVLEAKLTLPTPTQPLPVTPVTPDTVTHADDDAA